MESLIGRCTFITSICLHLNQVSIDILEIYFLGIVKDNKIGDNIVCEYAYLMKWKPEDTETGCVMDPGLMNTISTENDVLLKINAWRHLLHIVGLTMTFHLIKGRALSSQPHSLCLCDAAVPLTSNSFFGRRSIQSYPEVSDSRRIRQGCVLN